MMEYQVGGEVEGRGRGGLERFSEWGDASL